MPIDPLAAEQAEGGPKLQGGHRIHGTVLEELGGVHLEERGLVGHHSPRIRLEA